MSRLTGRLPAMPRAPGQVRPRPRGHRPAGGRPAGPVPRHGRRPRRDHPPGRRGRPRESGRRRCGYGDPRVRLDLRAEGIGTVLLATGYAPHHPWLKVPVIGPDGTSARSAAPPRRPALYVVGQRFQHRRDSATIDGARHDAHDVVSHLCRGRQPGAARPGAPIDDARLRRGGRRRPGRRRLHRDAARPRRRPGAGARPGGVRQRHPVHPRPDAGRRAAADPVGAARPRSSRRAPRRSAPPRSTRRRDPVRVTIRPHAGVDALYAPRRHVLDRILVDAAVACRCRGPPRRPGHRRCCGTGPAGSPASCARRSRARASVTATYVVGADGIRSVVADAAGAAASYVADGTRAPCATPTSRGWTRPATSGRTATARRPG